MMLMLSLCILIFAVNNFCPISVYGFSVYSNPIANSKTSTRRRRRTSHFYASTEQQELNQKERNTNSTFDSADSVCTSNEGTSEISKQEALLLSLGLIDEVESEDEKQKRMQKRMEVEEKRKKQKMNNVLVAVISASLAVCNYIYQFLHPISSVELLFSMQKSSTPLTVVGQNHKPTVIDFWAPWCDNCKASAGTLHQIENEFKDKVNFILVNGDDDSAWDLITTFGVDAIPHLALINEEGYVETALIGPVSGNALREDLNVLLNNVRRNEQGEGKNDLPFKMFDAFYNRPEDRVVHF